MGWEDLIPVPSWLFVVLVRTFVLARFFYCNLLINSVLGFVTLVSWSGLPQMADINLASLKISLPHSHPFIVTKTGWVSNLRNVLKLPFSLGFRFLSNCCLDCVSSPCSSRLFLLHIIVQFGSWEWSETFSRHIMIYGLDFLGVFQRERLQSCQVDQIFKSYIS